MNCAKFLLLNIISDSVGKLEANSDIPTKHQ